jgi:hypothetical protein
MDPKKFNNIMRRIKARLDSGIISEPKCYKGKFVRDKKGIKIVRVKDGE